MNPPPPTDNRTPDEIKRQKWIAFIFGLKDGLKFWQLALIKYSDIDELDTAPEIRQALKVQYFEYTQGANLLTYIVTISAILFTAITNGPELLNWVAQLIGLGV